MMASPGRTLPLGTVRLRRNKSGSQTRYVKYRTDGPYNAANWMTLARWWWLNNKGPIPHGKRVVRLDGDTLNDDPSNLTLGTCADAAAVWHINNPGASQRQYARAAAASAEHNRLRGRLHRLRSFSRTQWYPVDADKGVIFNMPHRHRISVYRDFGLRVPAGIPACDPRVHAAALGWRAFSLGAACILHVLHASPSTLDGDELVDRVNQLRQFRGWRPWARKNLNQVVHQGRLSARWIRIRRAGRSPAVYGMTSTACVAQGPICPVIGSRIIDEPRFQAMTKVDRDGVPVMPARDRRSVDSLARAIAGGLS